MRKSLPCAITDMFRMFAGLSMRARICTLVSIIYCFLNGLAGFVKLYLFDREAIRKNQVSHIFFRPSFFDMPESGQVGKSRSTYLTILAVFLQLEKGFVKYWRRIYRVDGPRFYRNEGSLDLELDEAVGDAEGSEGYADTTEVQSVPE